MTKCSFAEAQHGTREREIARRLNEGARAEPMMIRRGRSFDGAQQRLSLG